MATAFLDATLLPVTGTYRVVLDPLGAATETGAVVTPFTRTHQTTTLVSGTGVHAALSTPGQNLVGTWSGTAGQKLSVSVSAATACNDTLSLLAPDGTTLASTQFCSSTASTGVETLPVTGSYRVVLDPFQASTESDARADVEPGGAGLVDGDSRGRVRGNGTSTSSILVTIRNTTGTPVNGDTVTLTGTGSVQISPASGTSDATGKVTFTVKDAVAETVTFTATDTTAGVVADNPVVLFTSQTASTPALSAGVGSAVNLSTRGAGVRGDVHGGGGSDGECRYAEPELHVVYQHVPHRAERYDVDFGAELRRGCLREGDAPAVRGHVYLPDCS